MVGVNLTSPLAEHVALIGGLEFAVGTIPELKEDASAWRRNNLRTLRCYGWLPTVTQLA